MNIDIISIQFSRLWFLVNWLIQMTAPLFVMIFVKMLDDPFFSYVMNYATIKTIIEYVIFEFLNLTPNIPSNQFLHFFMLTFCLFWSWIHSEQKLKLSSNFSGIINTHLQLAIQIFVNLVILSICCLADWQAYNKYKLNQLKGSFFG